MANITPLADPVARVLEIVALRCLLHSHGWRARLQKRGPTIWIAPDQKRYTETEALSIARTLEPTS